MIVSEEQTREVDDHLMISGGCVEAHSLRSGVFNRKRQCISDKDQELGDRRCAFLVHIP